MVQFVITTCLYQTGVSVCVSLLQLLWKETMSLLHVRKVLSTQLQKKNKKVWHFAKHISTKKEQRVNTLCVSKCNKWQKKKQQASDFCFTKSHIRMLVIVLTINLSFFKL